MSVPYVMEDGKNVQGGGSHVSIGGKPHGGVPRGCLVRLEGRAMNSKS